MTAQNDIIIPGAIMDNRRICFSRCRPRDRDLLCATITGAEDIPGLFAPHSPIRVNVAA